MYFQDAIKVLVRRWYIVLAGALVTIGVAVGALFLVPTEYQARAR